MAFRDLIPKYKKGKAEGKYNAPPEAKRKIPGLPVKISSGNVEADFNKIVIQTALNYVTTRISQSTRDLYQGQVNVEMKPDSTVMVITVTLTHTKDRSQIVGNILVTRVAQNSGASVARRTGNELGQTLVRALSEKHKRPRFEGIERNPVQPPDYYEPDEDDDGRTLDEIERDDRILELMKKPICPICGPASIDFPDWDEDCGHDF